MKHRTVEETSNRIASTRNASNMAPNTQTLLAMLDLSRNRSSALRTRDRHARKEKAEKERKESIPPLYSASHHAKGRFRIGGASRGSETVDALDGLGWRWDIHILTMHIVSFDGRRILLHSRC